jgi:hypothetical protein
MKQIYDRCKIIIVARQAGTANSFIPILKKLMEGRFAPAVIAYKQAYSILIDNYPSVFFVDSFDKAKPILNGRNKVRFVLTGTSEDPVDDGRYWSWYKDKGIPTMSFVDSWVNYWQRFTSNTTGKTKFDLCPDYVAVIDDLMYQRMVENGCDEKRLVILGNPAFDNLNNYRDYEYFTDDKKQNNGQHNNYILYISQLLSDIYDRNVKKIFGYTENEVFELIINVLEELGIKNRKVYNLIYKPHPRENLSEVEDHINFLSLNIKNVKIKFSKLTSSCDLIKNSKLVTGMTSTLLYESMLMGRPVLSIQPNRRSGSDLTDGHSGINMVSNPRELLPEMENMIKGKSQKNQEIKHSNSTEKFISFIASKL